MHTTNHHDSPLFWYDEDEPSVDDLGANNLWIGKFKKKGEITWLKINTYGEKRKKRCNLLRDL